MAGLKMEGIVKWRGLKSQGQRGHNIRWSTSIHVYYVVTVITINCKLKYRKIVILSSTQWVNWKLSWSFQKYLIPSFDSVSNLSNLIGSESDLGDKLKRLK